MAKKKETRFSWWAVMIIPLVLLGAWVYTTTLRLDPNRTNRLDDTQPVLVYYVIPTETDFDFVAVERQVPKTAIVNQLALGAIRAWIAGPTELERAQGMSSVLNAGTEVNAVSIENGLATIDFNETFDAQMGGSARVMSIRQSIERIMRQFGVTGVGAIKLTVNNGEREAVLEP